MPCCSDREIRESGLAQFDVKALSSHSAWQEEDGVQKGEVRGYPKQFVERTVHELTFAGRRTALHKQKKKTDEQIMPFITTFHPGVKNLKQKLMQK